VPPTDFEFWRNGWRRRRPMGGSFATTTAVAGASIEQFSMDKTENRFPVAIYKPISAKNVEVSTRFKLVSGTMQSAGVAVRLMSASNYYVVRVSALEARVDLLRVMDGKTERIAGADAGVIAKSLAHARSRCRERPVHHLARQPIGLHRGGPYLPGRWAHRPLDGRRECHAV